MTMKEGTQTITFRLQGELKFAIEMEAHKQGRSVNNLLTQIVKEYLNLKKEKTTRKAAEFLGLPQATLARKKIKYDL